MVTDICADIDNDIPWRKKGAAHAQERKLIRSFKATNKLAEVVISPEQELIGAPVVAKRHNVESLVSVISHL